MKHIFLLIALLLSSCGDSSYEPEPKYAKGEKVMLKLGVEAIVIAKSWSDYYYVRLIIRDDEDVPVMDTRRVHEFEIKEVIN